MTVTSDEDTGHSALPKKDRSVLATKRRRYRRTYNLDMAALRHVSPWLVILALLKSCASEHTLDPRSAQPPTSRLPPRATPKVAVDTIFTPQSCLLTSQVNDQLAVTYVGTFTDNGKRFDASEDPKNPFVFVLGVGQVIKGWDEGMAGMCEGEKRILKIPSELAYGHAGAGDDIPPDSPLTFHVELIKIESRQYDSNPTKELSIQKTLKPTSCRIKSKEGDRLEMIYVGTLKASGLQFDAVKTPDQPFEFSLGAGEVIKGWDEGLKDMCIGERRRLIIPASMAYGSEGYPSSEPPIPSNADLVFDTELIDITRNHRSQKSDHRTDDRHDLGVWIWAWSVIESLSYLVEYFLVFF
ncbi:hypothetical protein PCANC_17769 [Puccinia coronata f. sp. avenae]|uniref:peptidylprolyl isomerase n=1 Tax=Puccinia coronata f. sp. avenae TaxID=200324 RepID=A0A2N5SJ61_9BASI|nr:hypothetical protein PCANC_17769 [Puccinia coronata f. sp. avenae]